jgi:hypothetical protein
MRYIGSVLPINVFATLHWFEVLVKACPFVAVLKVECPTLLQSFAKHPQTLLKAFPSEVKVKNRPKDVLVKEHPVWENILVSFEA